ncbi:MAG: hypothetical protein AAB381_02390 [Patescibacteria group bacterium]
MNTSHGRVVKTSLHALMFSRVAHQVVDEDLSIQDGIALLMKSFDQGRLIGCRCTTDTQLEMSLGGTTVLFPGLLSGRQIPVRVMDDGNTDFTLKAVPSESHSP